MRQLWRALWYPPYKLLFIDSPDLGVYMLAMTALAWGGWLMLPYESLTLSPAFADLVDSGLAEYTLGLITVLVACFKLTVLFYVKSPVGRVITSALIVIVWLFILISLIRGSPTSQGVAVYGTLASFSFLFFARRLRFWVLILLGQIDERRGK